jgi:peptide/nickel transport system substrate-binding protein
MVMSDPNTVVANLLAGNAHMVSDSTLRFQSGDLLQKEWAARGGGGTVYFSPAQVRLAEIQSRPELASPRGILDLRVRKAIAHAVDTKELGDALYDGKGVPAVTLAQLNSEQYALIDPVIAKYPFDPRRSEQLMADAGLTKGSDGVYTHPTDGRFAPEWRATSGGDSETQVNVLTDMLKRAGMDARPYILPQVQGADAQVRASFPTLSNTSTTGSTDSWPRRLIGANIARPENRWNGSNRGGWTHPDYEAFYSAYASSLDSAERNQLLARMMTVLSEQFGVLPMYYLLDVTAHVSVFQAQRLVGADGSIGWNAHEWELR